MSHIFLPSIFLPDSYLVKKWQKHGGKKSADGLPVFLPPFFYQSSAEVVRKLGVEKLK